MVSLIKYIQSTFPDAKRDFATELHQYWSCNEGLFVYDGVLFYNNRVVIPTALKNRVLRGVKGCPQEQSSHSWPGMFSDKKTWEAASVITLPVATQLEQELHGHGGLAAQAVQDHGR